MSSPVIIRLLVQKAFSEASTSRPYKTRATFTDTNLQDNNHLYLRCISKRAGTRAFPPTHFFSQGWYNSNTSRKDKAWDFHPWKSKRVSKSPFGSSFKLSWRKRGEQAFANRSDSKWFSLNSHEIIRIETADKQSISILYRLFLLQQLISFTISPFRPIEKSEKKNRCSNQLSVIVIDVVYVWMYIFYGDRTSVYVR